jgi:hypothetical protein
MVEILGRPCGKNALCRRWQAVTFGVAKSVDTISIDVFAKTSDRRFVMRFFAKDGQ